MGLLAGIKHNGKSLGQSAIDASPMRALAKSSALGAVAKNSMLGMAAGKSVAGAALKKRQSFLGALTK